MAIDSNMVKEIYARAQRKFFVSNLALSLANREPGDALAVQGGKKYHKPIMGFAKMQTYTPLTSTGSLQTVSTENEELEVSRSSHAQSIHINIDDTEKAQLKDQDLVSRYGDDLGRAMKDAVEKRWVSAIEGVHSIGSASSPVDFSGATILDTVEDGLALVDVADVADDIQRVLLVGPREYRAIERAAANRQSSLGDSTFVNGYPARTFMDALLVKSNNLPWSATLTLGANPTEDDTVTIAGVTFRFKASPTAAGDIDIGGTASDTADNLVAAIEGGSGAGTDYIALGLTQQMYLQRNRGINGTNNAGVISFTGHGDVGVSSDFTSGSNLWSAQVKNIFFTTVAATDLALQLDEGLEMSRPKPVDGEWHVTRLSGVIMHNAKTFTDGKFMTVKTFVDASNY